MTGLIRSQLTGLAGTIANLKERVRLAVAGELGRAVSGAVQQVVQAAVSGRTVPQRQESPPSYHRSRPSSWGDEDEEDRWGRPRDPWADDRDEDDYDRDRSGGHAAPVRQATPGAESLSAEAGMTAAVAAGLYVAHWWLGRKGTLLAAAGLGLGVGLLGVLGGPVVRTTVAVLAATADILCATDALGSTAARFHHL